MQQGSGESRALFPGAWDYRRSADQTLGFEYLLQSCGEGVLRPASLCPSSMKLANT